MPLLAVAYLLVVVTRGSAGLVPWVDVGLGNGAIVLSAALCLARAWLLPQDRWAWLLIGLAPLMYVAGNLYYYLWSSTSPIRRTRPGPTRCGSASTPASRSG